MIHQNSTRIMYQNPWMTISEDQVTFANGETGIYGVIDRQPGVNIVVLTDNKEILLSNQFRYPIQDYSWEIPGGGKDESETGLQAAVRELREETGLDLPAQDFVSHGIFYPLHSCSRETIELFSVRVPSVDLTKLGTIDQQEGIIEYTLLPLDEAPQWILNGKISDVFTAMAMLLAKNLYKKGTSFSGSF